MDETTTQIMRSLVLALKDWAQLGNGKPPGERAKRSFYQKWERQEGRDFVAELKRHIQNFGDKLKRREA